MYTPDFVSFGCPSVDARCLGVCRARSADSMPVVSVQPITTNWFWSSPLSGGDIRALGTAKELHRVLSRGIATSSRYQCETSRFFPRNSSRALGPKWQRSCMYSHACLPTTALFHTRDSSSESTVNVKAALLSTALAGQNMEYVNSY